MFAFSATAFADENVRVAQRRLLENGFYQGKLTGTLDSETSAALTRYQIRHGLAINGRLDPATAKALGVQPDEKQAAPNSDTWRQLRQSDEQFLERLNQGAIPTPHATPTAKPAATKSIPRSTTKTPRIEPHGPPPPPPENPPPAPPAPAPAATVAESRASIGPERLRDYIAAFVLAGLDPRVGAELEFFADHVNYFGDPGVSREKIRRDLVRYDQRWPERHFTLAGDLEIQPLQNDRVRVTFPLRYQLRGGSQHASGVVRKTLTLQRSGPNDLEIMGVNEEKASR